MAHHLFRLLLALCLLPSSAGADGPEDLAREIASGERTRVEGLVVWQRGAVRAEGFSSRLEREGLDIRSATKSITALLVGIAIDQGLIPSVDSAVVELLPEYAAQLSADPRKARMRVVDLLTMRSGLDCDDWNRDSPGHEDRMYRQRDWLAFWASTPMRDEPGERFSYCTGNVVALGRILANVSGRPASELARTHLFAPLGITEARWETWNRGRDVDTGGHLHLHPRSLARIGRLLLDGGKVDGRVVVSERWLATMTAEHSEVPGRQQRYGYLWWIHRTSGPDLPATRLWMAWGNGGNYLIVMPELEAVVAFAGRRYNRPDATEPLDWFGLRILPALGEAPSSFGLHQPPAAGH
jgi:CubicO group peptidase (beta-lactamase class C family)